MAISTPYKSDTVGSVSGTTFTASTGIFASDDVGRLIVLTDGNGELQHRKIVSYTSATEVELDHAWDATPWLDTVQDVEPEVGDSFVVSYIETDSAFTGESNVDKSGEQVRIYSLTVEFGAYVHITNMQVDLRSSNVEIGSGAGLIFGWYEYIAGEDAQVKDSCHIVDDSSNNGGNQFGKGSSSGDDFGMLDIYGGTILIDRAAVFWRLYYDNNPDKCQVRIINAQCFGAYGIGCRVDGYRSIFIVETVGANNSTGACNARTAVSRVSITAINGRQAGYVWLDINGGGPAGRLVFPRLNGLEKVIRCNTSGHGGSTNVMEVIAKKSELDQIPVFIEASNNPSGSHTFRYGNLLKPNYVDDTNTTLTDTIKTGVIDATSTIVDTEDVTSGTRSELFIRHTDIATKSGDRVLGDAHSTLYAPYKLNSFAFGKQINSANVSAEDYYGSTITLLNDLVLTETTKATIDAYTELETPEKLYDFAHSWLFDNYNSEAITLVSRSGNTIDAGTLDVTIDPSAASVFAYSGTSITVKASTFTGNITTTGAVTQLNGATVIGTISDSAGVRATRPVSITNIVSGSRLQLYNVTTATELYNDVVNATSYSALYVEGVDVTEGDDIRVRLVYQNGTMAFLPFEATVTASSAGYSVKAAQALDTVYNDIGLDGATLTMFSADYNNNEIDLVVGQNFTGQQLYARFCYFVASEQGVHNFFGALTALDEANFRNDVSVLDIYLNNNTNTHIVQTDNVRIYKSNDTYPVRNPTTGGGGIDIVWRNKIFLAETPTSGLTAEESAKLSKIEGLAKLIPAAL